MHLSQKQIIKFSLLSFILLFSFLIFLDSIKELQITNIENITVKNINQYMKVTGKIGKQNIMKNMSFFDIYDKTGKIPAIMFQMNQTLNQSLKYNFIGKITIYKNKPEMILYEIRTIN